MPISWEDQFGETYIRPVLKTLGGIIPGATLGFIYKNVPGAVSGGYYGGVAFDFFHPTYEENKAYAKKTGRITGSNNQRYGSINQVTGSSNRPPLKKVEYKNYRGSIWG